MWYKLTVKDYKIDWIDGSSQLIQKQTEKINGVQRLKNVIKAVAKNAERLKDDIKTEICIENCITGLKREVELYGNYELIVNNNNILAWLCNE